MLMYQWFIPRGFNPGYDLEVQMELVNIPEERRYSLSDSYSKLKARGVS